MNPPLPSAEEIFHRLLDESSALLAAPESSGIAIPDDELHREIIVPLLPAMLADAAIRGHWSEQHATGFVARIGRHFENGDPAPRWTPGDLEIHVTASYSAGADARALADTLLSEDSLRDMTAALMNQLLDALWPALAPAPSEPILPAEKEPDFAPLAAPAAPMGLEPERLTPVLPLSAIGPEHSDEIQPARSPLTHQPSRALIRAKCRKLATVAVRRGLAASGTPGGTSAAVVARRILQRGARRTPFGPTNRRLHLTSPRRLPRRASL